MVRPLLAHAGGNAGFGDWLLRLFRLRFFISGLAELG